MNKIDAYCLKRKTYNYGKLVKKFSEDEIFSAIKRKCKSRKHNPEHKNKYAWLIIYDEEIDFLINILNKRSEENE